MLSKGNTFREIERFIRQKGYDGAASTIRMFATRERKLMKEAGAVNGGSVEKMVLPHKSVVQLIGMVSVNNFR